jgi:hypothetical protein
MKWNDRGAVFVSVLRRGLVEGVYAMCPVYGLAWSDSHTSRARPSKTRETDAFSSAPHVACFMLRGCTAGGNEFVPTSKALLLAGGWFALTAALVATSGIAGEATSNLLLVSGAVVALILSRGPRESK